MHQDHEIYSDLVKGFTKSLICADLVFIWFDQIGHTAYFFQMSW